MYVSSITVVWDILSTIHFYPNLQILHQFLRILHDTAFISCSWHGYVGHRLEAQVNSVAMTTEGCWLQGHLVVVQ